MNPLSSMGRGVRGIRRLGAREPFMRALAQRTSAFEPDLDIVRIRFPNDDRPLSGCEAGTIVYVFATGDVTVCPYLVFAARTAICSHSGISFTLRGTAPWATFVLHSPGAAVRATGHPMTVHVGSPLLGRVLDGLGRPLDDGPSLEDLFGIEERADP